MRRRQSRGFTLIELLVAIGLMVFLMTIIVQIFITSTTVFNRAKAKTEIYQNARYALDRMGKEINNCLSEELDTQDFRCGTPGTAGATWYPSATTFLTDPEGSGAKVTRPYLVMITSTTWIDSSGKQQVGTAKVAYRIKRNSIPEALNTVSCTLERVLYTPAGYDSAADPWSGLSSSNPGTITYRLEDSTKTDIPNLDYCQYVYLDSTTTAHFAVQYFKWVSGGGAANKYYPIATDTLQPFDDTLAAPFDLLPQSVRVILDVIDEKDREIRTLSRQYTIYAAKAQ